MSNRKLVHEIAMRAAKQFLGECAEAGIPWTEVALGCESTIVAVVLACGEIAQTPDLARFSTEIIDSMTQAAHERALVYIRKRQEPHE